MVRLCGGGGGGGHTQAAGLACKWSYTSPISHTVSTCVRPSWDAATPPLPHRHRPPPSSSDYIEHAALRPYAPLPAPVLASRFLPVLKDMPSKYIYEPWTAPLDVQRRANCIIGQDYPRPIVDHATASKECVARIALAYKAGR